MSETYWLPKPADFSVAMKEFKATKLDPTSSLRKLRALATHNLDFVQISTVDRRLRELIGETNGAPTGFSHVKLAVLSSSTVDHLLPSIRVAGLRRGVLIETYTGHYGQYRQELMDSSSGLFQFKPDVVLFSFGPLDVGIHLDISSSETVVDDHVRARIDDWASLWKTAKEKLHAVVIQQNVLISTQKLFGQLDALVPASPFSVLNRINEQLIKRLTQAGVLHLDLDGIAAEVGKSKWFDPSLWFHAKQGSSPAYSPLYGEHVARILSAVRGLSHKCLVLDLDNTLWGGVIGDDGLSGLELGQGTGRGEAYLAFQIYLRHLKDRGVILAVCSKNEESNALSPFQDHPEMILKRDDFAVFVANWEDKATNLERIAKRLNIGVDSLVFFDDNPAERKLVRQYLPQVAVPEVPEDPALYAACLSDAGYFEAVSFTSDDLKRTSQYLANAERAQMLETSRDIDSFLESLQMKMDVAPFDDVGLSRIAQLINKSNQFNLTTRRYSEEQVKSIMADPRAITMQVRLKDSLGDNGMISVVIGKPHPENSDAMVIDTWLMSCRVLGRRVEQEVLNALVQEARANGFKALIGEYFPTAKNGLVEKHYSQLGFKPAGNADGGSRWTLSIENFKPLKTHIKTEIKQRNAR